MIQANLIAAVAFASVLGGIPAATAGELPAIRNGFEGVGDVLQIALPVAAAVCAVRKREFWPYAGRFAGQALLVEGVKSGLGKSTLNRRPNGSYNGFPSGHTAAAFYGASYLSRQCLQNKGQKAIAYGLAAVVAASRMQANKHNLGQVVAGALVGYMFDNVTVNFQGGSFQLGMRFEF